MSRIFRPKKSRTWLWPVLLVALVAGALAFAACGGEDPTPTPEPTATPEPTSTPVPTPTPMPEPTATPEPEPEPEPDADSSMMSITDIDENSTVGDLIGALSEEETACITAAFGEVILESMKDQPLAAVAASFELFPIQCLSEENAISAIVTMQSLQAGGFSDESISCLVETYGEHGVPSPTADQVQAMRSLFYGHMCLTDEEALALTGDVPAGEALPLPSQLRCVAEQTDLENLFKILEAFAMMGTATELPTPDPELMMVTAEVMAAQEACGIPTLGP